ncbi:hypothetical protein ERJ75_001777300 [Trypanosoma vivax]|nr:hypothetical protein ERJ75_001777300 [Trypanosoma vivax]
MPSKPGFLLQDAWDAAAAWARTVGEMGRAEGPHRMGTRAYNRRRPLRAKSARPRMKAESPGGAPKGPRREEGPHHQARRQVRRKQQAPAPSNARCLRRGRVGRHSSTCHAKVAREPRWKPKKRAAAPETVNSAADMVLDSAAEEGRQRCNQARPVAPPEAKREAASNSGSSSAQLRQASGSAGKRSASTQAAEGVRKRRWHHKSDGPRSAPPILGVGSGPRRQANANGVRVGAENVHNETPRRIRKAHGPEMSRGNAPLFIVSLKPARSSAVQRTRAPLSPTAAGEAPAQMLPSGLRGQRRKIPQGRRRQ